MQLNILLDQGELNCGHREHVRRDSCALVLSAAVLFFSFFFSTQSSNRTTHSTTAIPTHTHSAHPNIAQRNTKPPTRSHRSSPTSPPAIHQGSTSKHTPAAPKTCHTQHAISDTIPPQFPTKPQHIHRAPTTPHIARHRPRSFQHRDDPQTPPHPSAQPPKQEAKKCPKSR